MLLFVTAVSVVLIVSFLCSIFESVLLSVTRPQIEKLTHAGKSAGAGCQPKFEKAATRLAVGIHRWVSLTFSNCKCCTRRM